MFSLNSQGSNEILKNLINSIEKNKSHTGAISENDLREKIKAVDRGEVMKKLKSMGLGNIAQKLSNMTDEDILREVSKNPAILKKLKSLLK